MATLISLIQREPILFSALIFCCIMGAIAGLRENRILTKLEKKLDEENK